MKYLFIFYTDNRGKSLDKRSALIEVFSKSYVMENFPSDYESAFYHLQNQILREGIVYIYDRCLITDMMLVFLRYKPRISEYFKLIIVRRDGGV